jgi:predicted phage tail protein
VATGPSGSVTATATVVVPVDCVVSDWSMQSATQWGACSGGQQTRTETWVRRIITEPSGGGAACGPLQETRIGTRSCTDTNPTAPHAPVNMRASVSGSRVTLSWNRAATGGAPAGYRLYVGTLPGSSNMLNGLNVGNTTTVSGDLPRGAYYARVRAYNGVGVSPESNEAAFRVGANSKPRRPLNLTGSLQNGVATLSWSAPAGDEADAPTGYVIEAGSAAGLTNLATLPVGNVTGFQAVVPPGVYFVRVRAINELGAGDPSNEIIVQPYAGPGQPGALTESGEGSTVTLTWRPPTTGPAPSGYVIEAGSAPGLANLAVLRVGSMTSFTTTAPPGIYYVRVRGWSIDGAAGEASNEVVVRR